MYGIEEYVKSVLGEKSFSLSEILYGVSVPVAAVQVISLDYNKRGAVAVLCHVMDIQVPAGVAFVTITDNYGRIVKSFAQQVEMSGNYIFPWFAKTGQVQFTCNVNTVNFVIAHQYITINK